MDSCCLCFYRITLVLVKYHLGKRPYQQRRLLGSHCSYVNGNPDEYSDIDIGIKGLPPQKFFATHSMLEDATGKTVDLVDFDEKPQFFALLQSLGELRKIG